METYLIYLLKASIGIFLFYLVYQFILRKETYYTSNRIYLVFGLALAVLLPLFPITYILPVSSVQQVSPIVNSELLMLGNNPNQLILPNIPETVERLSIWQRPIFLISLIYICGALIFLLRLMLQTSIILIKMQKCKKSIIDGITTINLKKSTVPFSFFKVVFINIENYSKEELSNIIAHEKVHILERHWIDLLIIELLTVLFWMNPVVWLYERSIKQNHEFLADQGVLLAGYSPGQYQALLINQLMGVKIIGFTNNLNYSLNKKRMEMMKKKKSLTIKKLKLFMALPLVALLVFAFAEREIVFEEVELPNPEKSIIENPVSVPFVQHQEELAKISGTVVAEDGTPLVNAYFLLLDNKDDHPYRNTNIVLEGKYKHVITDAQGKFEIELPKNKIIFWMVSHTGYYTKAGAAKSDGKEPYYRTFKLKKGIYHLSLTEGIYFPAPHDYRNHELLKNTPVDVLRANNQTMMNMQKFPNYKNGGPNGLAKDIERLTTKYSNKTGQNGSVKVSMHIDENGDASDFGILAYKNSKLKDESIRIMQELNNWTPGIQGDKNIPVDIAVVVSFN
ncbi:MAG: energy transducer TonB [Cyclobacteriaceae bacterium]|nr:energy transducer TonB [Cyclobacteriaceae bacterium]